MVLDFKEIPEANTGSGLQDTFELFTRDFLSFLGYRIIQDPDRGADGKKDLIVEEVIKGITDEYTIRWLVSCKHYAHTGRAVKDSDEISISDRLLQHECDGFMGVYSTLAATSLSGMVARQKHHVIFDHEKIESFLLESIDGHTIASRYFPISFKNFQMENPIPSNIFGEETELRCDFCNQDLLKLEDSGIFSLWVKANSNDKEVYEDMYFSCRGNCDDKMSARFSNRGLADRGWEDINDLCNPAIWITKLMAFINGIQHDRDMGDEAFEKMKRLFINTYPYIARHLTTNEKMRVKRLLVAGLL